MININNLHKQYGDNILFENAKLKIADGDKIALLGQNGKGKTTLIKCVGGFEDFVGSIETTNTISIMEQEKDFSKISQTFQEYIDLKIKKVTDRLTQLEKQFTDPLLYENQELYVKILQEYELLSKRSVENSEEARLKQILENIGFSTDLLKKPIDALSGGQQTAIRLAECLAKKAQVYILDEPTNHLDSKSIRWLEESIRKSQKTYIIISHDRYFIDRFATKVVEIENKQLVTYNTNYSGYVVQRAHHRDTVERNFDSNSKKYKKLMESAKVKREWASKHGNRAFRIQADNLQRRAQQLDQTQIVDDKYNFQVIMGKRTSNRVFELKNVSMAFDNKFLFENIGVEFFSTDKIALTGNNGVGKSTFLKLLKEDINPTTGHIKPCANISLGFFDQKNQNLPLKQTVLDYFLDNHYCHENQIIALAKRFGFIHDIRKKKIGSLSGGQKAKLQLMHILLGGFNVLLLDEPTNHLDLELRESLEKALLEFTGCIIFVSHDRYFTKKMANKIFSIKDKGLKLIWEKTS